MSDKEHNEKVRKSNYWRNYWAFMIFLEILILNWIVALGLDKIASAIRSLT